MSKDLFSGLVNAMRDVVGEDELFPTEITPEEAKEGFAEREIANPSPYGTSPGKIRIVAMELNEAQIAVKTADPDGTFLYAIWDSKRLRPVEAPVPSLASLVRMKSRS